MERRTPRHQSLDALEVISVDRIFELPDLVE